MIKQPIKEPAETNAFCKNCNKRFSSSDKQIGIHTKCGHFIHLDKPCFSPKCNICDAYCGPIWAVESINENSQNYINALSIVRKNPQLTYYDRLNGVWRILKSIPVLIGLYWRLYTDKIDINYLQWFNKYLVELLNINVMCNSNDKAKLNDNSYKRIIIANHTNYHDLLAVSSLFEPNNIFGFVAAPTINKNPFGKAITKIIPHIMVQNNTTDQMSSYDKKYKLINDSSNISNYDKIKSYFLTYPNESKLIICPEGMLTHHLTISKFRSTAFKLGYPVQPVVLRYAQPIYDLVGFDIFCYPKIDVEIKVLDPIDTDGSEKSIEQIREKMAEEGNLLLSNVVNKIM